MLRREYTYKWRLVEQYIQDILTYAHTNTLHVHMKTLHCCHKADYNISAIDLDCTSIAVYTILMR